MEKERCSKPQVIDKSSGKYNDQRRPDGISAYVWWNMMSKDERKQWWEEHPDVRLVDPSVLAICCRPVGISSLIGEVPTMTLCSSFNVWNDNMGGGYSSDASD